MLDQELVDNLKSLFSNLTTEIKFVIKQTSHPKQQELISLLEQVTTTCNYLKLINSNQVSLIPSFSLESNESARVHFEGIPGGHEFSSLVLAILHLGGLGKSLDHNIIQRIKQIKTKLELKTYISLSCENCPDVVQILNRFAIINPNINHTMIDGELVTDQIEKLKIQGVPAVFIDDKLIHSGKANLTDLLNKLEQQLSNQINLIETNLGHFDISVLGGGPAGVAAAIYSSRKGLKTILTAETLGGQVKQTKGIENLISIPYTEGPQLVEDFEKHLKNYPIEIFEHRRVKFVENKQNAKLIQLDSGESFSCDSLIIATGAKWRELDIPGEKEYLGRGVAFCPHCDGPFYKNKKVVVVGGGNSGVEAAIDLSNIASHITLIEFAPELKADAVLTNKAMSLTNITIITNTLTTEILGNDSKVTHLKYQDRKTSEIKSLEVDGIFIQIGLIPNSELFKELVDTNKFGEIVVDNKGRTSTEGIYAAGDVATTPYKQIVTALGSGANAALTAFEDKMKK